VRSEKERTWGLIKHRATSSAAHLTPLYSSSRSARIVSLGLSSPTLAVSPRNFSMTSNPLLVDPTEQPKHFDSAAMLSAFETGAKEDQEEAEGDLELASLSPSLL
jgi:hypothetical protein